MCQTTTNKDMLEALVGKSTVLKGTPDSRVLNVEELVKAIDPTVLPIIAQMAIQSSATTLRQISIGVFENQVNLQESITKVLPYSVESEDSAKAFLMVYDEMMERCMQNEKIYDHFKDKEIPRFPTSLRQLVLHWVMGIQLALQWPTEVLHKAVCVMDAFHLYYRIQASDYQLLALGALSFTRHSLDEDALVDYQSLVAFADFAFTQTQVINMEKHLADCSSAILAIPSPQKVFYAFLPAMCEFSDDMLEWIQHAFNYIFELGLFDNELSFFPIYNRVVAVILLLRFILKKYCDCSVRGSGHCEHREMPLWTDVLAKFTMCKPTMEIRTLAKSFATVLRWTVEMFVAKGVGTTASNPLRLSFLKYSCYEYQSVAMDPKMRSLTTEDIDDLLKTEV